MFYSPENFGCACVPTILDLRKFRNCPTELASINRIKEPTISFFSYLSAAPKTSEGRNTTSGNFRNHKSASSLSRYFPETLKERFRKIAVSHTNKRFCIFHFTRIRVHMTTSASNLSSLIKYTSLCLHFRKFPEAKISTQVA